MLLKVRSKGNDVKQIQEWLNIEADGIFGPKTKKAVIAFQKEYNLVADGIVGNITYSKMVEVFCGTTEEEKQAQPQPSTFIKPVDYKQGDSRWSSRPYTSIGDKKQTIGSSGCGPTALADILATIVDKRITPMSVAELFVKNGFRTPNSGTAWTAFKWAANKYGIKVFKQTDNIEVAKKYLAAGAYVVCSMKKGYWTTGGHYICAWKYDNTYMYANDPASTKRTKQKLTDFAAECKQYFCFLNKE